MNKIVTGSFFNKAGEIDVRGQIALAEVFQHAVIHLMLLVASYGAAGTWVGEKFLGIEAIVGDEDGSTKRSTGQITNPREHGEIDFECVAGGEILRQLFRLLGEFSAGQITGNELECLSDVQFLPALAIPTQAMHGEGIRQLVAEKKSVLGAGLQRCEALYPLRAITEALRLRFTITRIRLHDEIAQRTAFQSTQNVLRELSVMRALLDDREILRFTERLPFLNGLHGQQLAEQRPDAHAGKKIALSADATRPGSIIAVFRMIERQFHDPRKGQGPGGELITENLR